jgi:hypothetical protein
MVLLFLAVAGEKIKKYSNGETNDYTLAEKIYIKFPTAIQTQ